jgi:hypothetical protein
MACICWVTHVVAAPMPRTGSVWLEAVCLVPKLGQALYGGLDAVRVDPPDQSPQIGVEVPRVRGRTSTG